jgi:glycosyltransferase involved in cell wall biosynthesis
MIVHDEERYVSKSVGDILAQSFRDLELIVVDDGSTDRTPELLWNVGDDRLRVFTQPRMGRPRARNRALAEVRGEYVAIMDGDDGALPDRLARQVARFEHDGDLGVLGTAYREIDAAGSVLREVRPPEDDRALRACLCTRYPFLTSSLMIRRRVIDEVGRYDETFTFSQDYEFMIRAARRTRLANLPDVLAEKRIHAEMIMMSSVRENLRHNLRARLRAIREFRLPPYYYATLLKPALLYCLPPAIVRAGIAARSGTRRVVGPSVSAIGHRHG